ncbi:MAG: hypothetical protein K9K63_16850 [Desulfotignum sp.]|nr:hypothetical protein [Desulfotignum sp.]MCF8089866.1 hypothetical protein [Desulfotignum sp.]MCF8138975.1 hypothetical protein [Desulfotignum sp.]
MTTNRETGDLAGFYRAQGISQGKLKYYTGWRELISHVSGIHALMLKLIHAGGMRSHPPAFLCHALASGRI